MGIMYDKILGRLREGTAEQAQGLDGTIRILFIGNSNMLDSVSYLPAVLKNINPGIKLTVGTAYIAGSSIAQHMAYFIGAGEDRKVALDIPETDFSPSYAYGTIEYWVVPNDACPYKRQRRGDEEVEYPGYNYRKSVNGGAWSKASYILAPEVLAEEKWDLVVFQDAPNNIEWSNVAPYLFTLQQEIGRTIGHATQFGWMTTHAAANTGELMTEQWTGLVSIARKVLQQTGVSMLFSPGTAVQNMRTIQAIAGLGEGNNQNLCVDDIHLQEGIGCLGAAYTIACGILNAMGLDYQSVIGEQTRPDEAWLEEQHIPGQHLGHGVIGIDERNCLIAQVAAINATKYPFKVIRPSMASNAANRIVSEVNEFIPAPAIAGTENQILAVDSNGNPVWVNPAAGLIVDAQMSENSTNPVQNKVITAALAGKANTKGTYENFVAGDLISLGDRVTVAGKFIVRPTANDAHIDSSADALLLQLVGGCGEVEADAFKIHALQWNGTNQLDPNAWSVGKTSGYITGAVSNGTVGSGSNKLCIIHCPKCEVGNYGTAERNNGYLLTSSDGSNLKVGDGTIIGVWYSPTLPAVETAVDAVEEHVFSGHPETFYIPKEGFMIVEVANNANLTEICAHLAWSKDYDKFTAYEQPKVLVLSVSPLTSAFETVSINGETCIVLRGIESGGNGIFDNIVIHAEGGGTYERNIASQLLTGLTWTETLVQTERIDLEDPTETKYLYTASLPTTGTYAAMRDGLIRSDVEGIEIDGFNLVYETSEQITPATAFAGKYVDYQIATPVIGTHSINPTGKKPDDMGTEEVIGGANPTGTIVISYMRGFRDTMRALYTDFKAARAELEEMKLHSPLYCVGEWLENAHTASPNDQNNTNALAVFGNKEWALDWRPFIVDMSAVEGETKKRPMIELRKNNWLRDIYGNWAPVVGITAAMRDECMANALYSDSEGQNLYCAAGAYNPEAFLELCSIETVEGIKRLTHPTLYKAVDASEPATYVEVTHYLMPWETTETKYSVFVGRKDTVYLLDNLVGASGKEWNGVIASNVNFWDGVDVKVYALKPTGICPSPVTSIVENQVSKIRSFFFNYNASDTYSKGTAGASGCTMFRNNGHYRTNNISQMGTKSRARANNYVNTNPFPVAEGGFHARNTFLRCVETALGTKNLCVSSRFSSGVSSVDGCSSEATWLANGGIRYKAEGAANWSYCKLDGDPAMYYGSGATKSTTNGSNWLSGYGPLSKTLEAQIAVSFAVEFGITAGEKFSFNGCTWWYMNPTATGFAPKTVADGYMNARVYKIVTGTFTGYASANATETTDFDIEVCVRTGLMLGCDMSGDGGPYWGGGCEIVGECKTTPASGSYGYTLKAYIEPDQEKWTNETSESVNIGQKFAFESKYRYAGSIVTRSNGYMRRRLPNTPVPASMGGAYSKGECAYGYMANYWGTAGKKTRVGVRFGSHARSGDLSARCLSAINAAGSTYTNYCGSAQVLLDVQ